MTAESKKYPFILACKGQKTPHTPVWIMRQAGRYLPEYRDLRQRHSFLEVCRTPELATEATVMAVKTLGVDAAILFSDILIPVEAMGMEVEFTPGPVFKHPVQTNHDVKALKVPDPAKSLKFVMEAVTMIRRELEETVPLIGFSGAPFTLAAYMVEGKGSKDFALVKALAFGNPKLFESLMNKITSTVIDYLKAQAESGAQALQLFDTWGGLFSPADYRRYVLPWNIRVVESLGKELPVIYYINDGAALYHIVREIPAQVFGIDWRMEIDRAWSILGYDRSIQGNLDPAALMAPEDELAARIDDILDRVGDRPGHIFNLGHGIQPAADPDKARFLVNRVHQRTRR